MKKTNSISQKKIDVLDKYGKKGASIPYENAKFSVKREKAIWVDNNTIQILYHHQDYVMFKKQVYERDGYECQYCGLQLEKGDNRLTVDHVIPQRLGGSILPKNMVCSCRACNEQKAHRTFKEYFLHLHLALYWHSLKYKQEGEADNEETLQKLLPSRGQHISSDGEEELH